MDSKSARNLLDGSDGELVAELAQGSRQHLGTFLLFSGTHFVALLDKSRSFMQGGCPSALSSSLEDLACLDCYSQTFTHEGALQPVAGLQGGRAHTARMVRCVP